MQSALQRWLAASVACVAITATGGCGSGGSAAPAILRPVSVHLIRAPHGAIMDGPVWLAASRRLVVTYVPAAHVGDAAYDHLYSLTITGARLTRLPLPAQRGCRLTSQAVGVALADGRLAYLQQCWGQEIPHRALWLRVYDPRHGTVGYLRRYPLPIGSGYFALSPDLANGVVDDGRGLHQGLLRLGRTAPVRARLPFASVGYPAWSRDGRFIVLDAAPRGDAQAHRNVYLLDGEGRVRRLLLHDLVSVGPAAWSPDGRRLALAMQPAHGAAGLYLVDVANGDARLVLEGDQFGSAAWVDRHTVVASVGALAYLGGYQGPVGLDRIRLPG